MKKSNALTFFLAMAILSSCSSSFEDSPDQEVRKQRMDKISNQGLGFRAASSANSAVLQSRRQGVVKILIPAGPSHALKDIISEKSSSLRLLYAKLKGQAKEVPSITQDLLTLQISRCIQDNTSDCQVRTDFHTHTGFFVNNGKMLITSARLADEEAFDAEKLDILAYNEDGSLRIDEQRPLRFHAIEDSPAATKLTSLMSGTPAGHLTLVSETATGPSLTLALPRTISAEHDFSILGYPGKTQDRDGATNSDGQQMYYSMGEWTALGTAFAKVGLSLSDIDSKTTSDLSSNLLAIRADSDSQMLGSPILNWQGDVVGVVVATSPTLENKFTFAQRLWQRH